MTMKARPAEEVFRTIEAAPLSFGRAIRALRLSEEETLERYAERLGVSRQNLCDVEKERRAVSLDRAATWARVLGVPEIVFVQYAVRSMLEQAGLSYEVQLVATKKRSAKKRHAA
jgi:transcriptional regulator with XRE-family HTH domain